MRLYTAYSDNETMICGKCGESVPDGTRSCPKCGARFIEEGARYQPDGRTISTEDPDAYLKAPAPVYKKVIPWLLISFVVLFGIRIVWKIWYDGLV